MKKKKVLALIFSSLFILNTKNVYAYSSSNYEYRSLCGNFEVAGFHSDGYIDKVACYSNYEQARNFMKSNGADDLAIMTKVNGKTKIIDANVALLDLTIPPDMTYFYTNSELTGSSYTYGDTGSLYGGVDGAHIDTAYSGYKNAWVAKVKTGNFTGWIHQDYYEIVPITWVKSSSSYTVTDNDIRHNYVAKIQNYYSGNAGSTIGPKPDMLNPGTYFSYDGHYFYNDLKTMIKDYKNGNYNNAVNKNNVYYNYYMYLSNHTKTKYSSTNINEYIRNNMGIYQDTYGNSTDNGSSRLYGKGTFFYYAQEKYGVNAILALSLSRNETNNGRSNLAINKNNGFGLNAVDSSPTESANWYASFANSILGYASKYITYGYAHPEDWRYFGPQFGDKWIGMNVKYASDTFWSEKMASNYYNLDKALGLQDYNTYQLGVVTRQTNAYASPNTSSKFIYSYPEAEDGVVIVGETTGTTIDGNNKWYKVVSDLNIDSNYNEITSGNYNWSGYVYIPAAYVKKINTPKTKYFNPNDTFEYEDKDYEYDLLVENTELKPKVAISTKETPYYYDSTISSRTGKILAKDRYVMVYAIAYDGNSPVSYLVTSDYKYDQKHWISADSLKIITSNYGKFSVNVAGNQFTWVTSTTQDLKQYLIGGQYTNSYAPILEETYVNGQLWYKVPVELSTNSNIYGWTLATYPGVSVTKYTSTSNNNLPVINAKDTSLKLNSKFDPLTGITASDAEDGDLTGKIVVTENTVVTSKAGTYKVTYSVTDSSKQTTTKTINVTVLADEKPIINAEDTEITINHEVKINVTATDKEDGDITKNLKIKENTVNNRALGTYKIVYEVTDSANQTTTKEIKVTIVKDQVPVINATNKEIVINSNFDPKQGVTATDKEDGDITKNLKIKENTVNNKALGTYKIVYEVTDSANQTTTKEIKVSVVEKVYQEKEGNFYFNYLKENDGLLFLQGYQTITGIDNNLNTKISYELIFENVETNEETIIKAQRIEKDIPKSVYSPDGKDYNYSWFNAEINIDDLPLGNYKVYAKATTIDDIYYSKSLVSNKTYNSQVTKVKSSKHSATISNNYDTSNSYVEFKVRNDLTLEKNGSYVYNQYEKYTKFEFVDNKLYLRGNSYSYGMDLSKDKNVKRNIIFENTTNYKTYIKDLSSITDGNYQVFLPVSDNLDKTRAWYDKKIDISDLPKGKYLLYISTESNIKDTSEMKEKLGRSLNNVVTTINNKKYTFTINKSRGNRIELTIS